MEVSKSIWDVRFAPRKMALDAACTSALTALDEWITMHGNHVELNDRGEVIRGAGGKFNGKNIYNIKLDKLNSKIDELEGQTHGLSFRSPEKHSLISEIGKLRREATKIKDRQAQYSARVRDRKEKEFKKEHPMESLTPMPSYVKDMTITDKYGKENNVPVPKDLGGAEEYFAKMFPDMGEVKFYYSGAEHEGPWGRMESGAKAWKSMVGYPDGGGGIERWREEVKNGEKTKEWHEKYSDYFLKGYFKDAPADPRGVGKWMATDLFHKMEQDLSPERRNYYAKKVAQWEKTKK